MIKRKCFERGGVYPDRALLLWARGGQVLLNAVAPYAVIVRRERRCARPWFAPPPCLKAKSARRPLVAVSNGAERRVKASGNKRTTLAYELVSRYKAGFNNICFLFRLVFDNVCVRVARRPLERRLNFGRKRSFWHTKFSPLCCAKAYVRTLQKAQAASPSSLLSNSITFLQFVAAAGLRFFSSVFFCPARTVSVKKRGTCFPSSGGGLLKIFCRTAARFQTSCKYVS